MNNISDDIIKKYLEGDCSEEDFIRINRWVKESKENAYRLFLLEETYWAGKRNPMAEHKQTKQAELRLDKRLEKEKAAQQSVKKIRHLMKYAAVIAVVLLTGSGLGYWIYRYDHSSEMLTAHADDTVQLVTLPDGTKVWLNQSTTLSYPREFTGNERNVYLEGEAYFEVTKNHQKPFIVENESMSVTVLGTTFNFKCSKNCRLVEASLIEGEIKVKGHNEEGMIILSPGQKAELNKTTGRLLVKEANTRLDAVWYNGLIPFEKADIFTIAKTLERFYSIKIIFSPDFKSDKTYSGVLKKKDTIDSVLKSLNNVIPFSYRAIGDSLFISLQN